MKLQLCDYEVKCSSSYVIMMWNEVAVMWLWSEMKLQLCDLWSEMKLQLCDYDAYFMFQADSKIKSLNASFRLKKPDQ